MQSCDHAFAHVDTSIGISGVNGKSHKSDAAASELFEHK